MHQPVALVGIRWLVWAQFPCRLSAEPGVLFVKAIWVEVLPEQKSGPEDGPAEGAAKEATGRPLP